jgi:hypothetical protein
MSEMDLYSAFVPSERSAFWPHVNQTLVSRPPGVTEALSVALEDETDVADPVVATGANPTVVNDFVAAVVVPTEFVASYAK